MKSLVLFFFLFLAGFELRTNAQELEFEHITNHDGLAGTGITGIIKDSQGYMWFGFFDGLSRYDGYTFKNYANDPQNPNSINENFVRCFGETKDGTLIIGFQYKGICIYNRLKDNFERFVHLENDSNSLSNNNILAIYIDKKENVWIGTREGLDCFDIKQRKFIHYKGIDKTISSIAEDAEGNLWLYEKGDLLFKLNPSTGKKEYFNFHNKQFIGSKTFFRGGTLKFDSHQNLWIGTESKGLTRYNFKSGKFTYYNVYNKSLGSNIILSLHEDDLGQMWIGTDGAGLYLYNHENDILTQYNHDPNVSNSLSGNAIYSIYQCDKDLIWLGTYAAGINIYKKSKRKFSGLTQKGKAGKVLSQKSVISMIPAKGGKLWLGTDGGGLNLFDPKKREVQYFNKDNSPLTSNIIKSIEYDHQGNLWLGSYGSGVCRVNFETGKSTTYSPFLEDESRKIPTENVWALKHSSNNKMYLGLISLGLVEFNETTEMFYPHHIDTTAENHSLFDVNVIIEDQNKDFWIGSDMVGLIHYSPANGHYTFFKKDPKNKYSINDENINCIYEDPNGTIWVGTKYGGLNKLVDKETKRFLQYLKKDGLPSENVKSIISDKKGNIWVSTNNGISYLDLKTNKFTHFDEEDGLVGKDFNMNCAYRAEDGYLYFGATEGLNYLNPDSINFNLIPPKIVLTDFKIYNESIEPGKEYNGKIYLDSVISLTSTIQLDHNDNVFSIEFAALDFISPGRNKYAYRLKGFHDEWTYVNASKRFVNYTNLDPGTYVFEVKGSNNDGVWNEGGNPLIIKIFPPWWGTWFFRIGVLVAVVFISIGFNYYRLSKIESQNKYLTDEVEKRTREIRQQQDEILLQKNALEHLNKTKDKFFSIVGHDLKGPINAFTFLTENLKANWNNLEEEAKKEYINHIEASSLQVKNLVHNLLEWARAQGEQVKAEKISIPVEKVFKENVDLLQEQAAQKNITIHYASPEDHIVCGDFNMVSTIVRNILSNAVKYTPHHKRIYLTSEKRDNAVILKITDEGVGMSELILSKLFELDKGPSVKGTNKETGTGLGLIISQEFAALNKGRIYAESTKGVGSTFYVELPCD